MSRSDSTRQRGQGKSLFKVGLVVEQSLRR